MPAPHAVRRLYRVAAIIDERSLYDLTVYLAANKAVNVEIAPVMADAPAPGTGTGTGKAGRPTTRSRVLAAMKPGTPMSSQQLKTVLGGASGSVDQALAQLAKDGGLVRLSPGIYQLPASGHPTTNGSAAPKGPRVAGSAAFLLDLFKGAPDHKLTRKELVDALAGRGQSARSLDGVIHRIKSKIKRVEKDTYQLRGT